jgi:hypothetical protein
MIIRGHGRTRTCVELCDGKRLLFGGGEWVRKVGQKAQRGPFSKGEFV